MRPSSSVEEPRLRRTAASRTSKVDDERGLASAGLHLAMEGHVLACVVVMEVASA